jgi:glycosyltransferase involved in cell wall biosynthesis
MNSNKRQQLTIVLVAKDNVIEVASSLKRLNTLNFFRSEGVEILLIDSSTTTNRGIIEQMSLDNSINFAWRPPSGIYSAMNDAIDLSTGEWIWFLNPGDYAELDCDTVMRILEDECNSLSPTLIFKTKTIDEKGRFVRYRNLDLKIQNGLKNLFSFNYCHQGIIYRKSLFDSGLRYDTIYKIISDKILNDYAISRQTKLLDITLASFHKGGISSNIYLARFELCWYCFKKITGTFTITSKL